MNSSNTTRRAQLLRLLTVVAVAVAAAAPELSAQVPNRESALETRRWFMADLDTLQNKMLALANAIPAEKYSWRPAPGVRSIGEAFMHVASEYYVFTPMAYGATASPIVERGMEGMKKFEATSSKTDVLEHLKQGFAYMKQQINGLDP